MNLARNISIALLVASIMSLGGTSVAKGGQGRTVHLGGRVLFHASRCV
jgi:hypothetical protein